MEEITKYVTEIANKVDETRDDFIFTTILRFMEHDTEMSKIPISKQLLCRALICFRQEHAEEYYRLLDESNGRVKEVDECGK